MSWLRNKKNNFQMCTLIWRPHEKINGIYIKHECESSGFVDTDKLHIALHIPCSPFNVSLDKHSLVVTPKIFDHEILQKNYRKMTILLSFSYNSLVFV